MKLFFRRPFYLFSITSVVLIVYVCLRCLIVGITYDEVWTLNTFVSDSVINIVTFKNCDANNHLLNTLFIKTLFLLGRPSVFLARFPNLLSFVIYLFFSYKLGRRFFSSFESYIVYLLLVLNPFLIDFFGLARGYGLSLGFLLPSIYFGMKFFESSALKDLLFSYTFGAFAVLSSFSTLNFYVALFVVLNLRSILQLRSIKLWNSIFIASFISVLLTFVVYEPLRKLKLNGNLYYGGGTGLYADTLSSLVSCSLYDSKYVHLTGIVLNVFLVLLFLAFCNSIITNFWRTVNLSFLYQVLAITVLSIIFQHHFLGTLYLIDRTALFLYPLIILSFCLLLNESNRFFSRSVFSVLLILFFCNFLRNVNLTKTNIWFFESHTKEVLNYLNSRAKQSGRPIRVDFSWPLQNSFRYYLKHEQISFVEDCKIPTDRDQLNVNSDYYLYLGKSLEKVGYDANTQKVLSFQRDTILSYNNECVYLFRLKGFPR